MSDIRPQLYSTYVSTFKDENVGLTEGDLANYYRWCDARYYPHLAQLRKDARILEIGCGHGRILRYLQSKGFTNVTGIDISEEQVAIAKAAGLDAHFADVFDYLTHSGPIDCVIAIDLVEHFTKEELYRLFTQLRDVMTPDAPLLIQTVNGEGLFPRQIIYGDLTHMTIFTPGSMKQMLRAVGFEAIQVFETAPLREGLKGLVRNAIWSVTKKVMNSIRKIEAGKSQEIWTENFITTARRT